MTKELIERYNQLLHISENATQKSRQSRGYEFEKLIFDALERDGLCPKSSYKIKGEQIDGSFILGDKVYLLETKWQEKQMSVSDIYEFKGKVDGKLVGTIGIFISMSGFSKDSVDALICGKELNIILFDRDDFELGIKRNGAFKEILLKKIRAAAEHGTPYLPLKDIVKVEKDSVIARNDRIHIICEGRTDERILKIICRRIANKKDIIITMANGMRNLPLLANEIWTERKNCKLILVADSDGNEEKVRSMFYEMLCFEGWHSVIINDSIESWFDIDKRRFEGANRELVRELEIRAENTEIEELKRKHSSFRQFYELVTDDK